MNEHLTDQPQEYRSRPAGPLEEGDQALVDAIQAVAEGADRIGKIDENGTYAHLIRKTTPANHDIVIANTSTSSGVKEYLAGRGASGGTAAFIRQRSTRDPRYHVVSATTASKVGKNPDTLEVDRAGAQQLKLEIAQNINQIREDLDRARDNLGKTT